MAELDLDFHMYSCFSFVNDVRRPPNVVTSVARFDVDLSQRGYRPRWVFKVGMFPACPLPMSFLTRQVALHALSRWVVFMAMR